MLEFLVLLLVLLVGGASLYYVYDRVYRKSTVSQPTLYVEALRDLLDNKLESAFTKLRQVVAEDPNNLDAYLRLGQILREHNHPQRALQIHKDLTLRFGLNDAESQTLDTIGKQFGVTRERIRQIEAKTIEKLRKVSESVER